jgi:hypothetical protein
MVESLPRNICGLVIHAKADLKTGGLRGCELIYSRHGAARRAGQVGAFGYSAQ